MATSHNGWPVLSRGSNRLVTLPQITGRVLTGPVWVVFYWLARQFETLVEPIRRDWSWGYAYRRIAGSVRWSNHASGTAIDLNAPKHPAGRTGTFTKTQTKTILTLISEAGGIIRWGATFRDEMHFEISPATNPAAVERFAVKLLQDALNDRLSVDLVVDGIRGPKTADALKVFQASAGLVVDGIDGPKTWAALTNPRPTEGDQAA